MAHICARTMAKPARLSRWPACKLSVYSLLKNLVFFSLVVVLISRDSEDCATESRRTRSGVNGTCQHVRPIIHGSSPHLASFDLSMRAALVSYISFFFQLYNMLAPPLLRYFIFSRVPSTFLLSHRVYFVKSWSLYSSRETPAINFTCKFSGKSEDYNK